MTNVSHTVRYLWINASSQGLQASNVWLQDVISKEKMKGTGIIPFHHDSGRGGSHDV